MKLAREVAPQFYEASKKAIVDIKQVESDMKSYHPPGFNSMGRLWDTDTHNGITSVFKGIRDWGSWQSEPGADSEDDDFQILDRKDLDKATKDFNAWVKRQKWAKQVKEIRVSPEEKNWLVFIVKFELKKESTLKEGTPIKLDPKKLTLSNPVDKALSKATAAWVEDRINFYIKELTASVPNGQLIGRKLGSKLNVIIEEVCAQIKEQRDDPKFEYEFRQALGKKIKDDY